MTPEQARQRDSLLARNDEVLERWPRRAGGEFAIEMGAVAEGFEALARSADRDPDDALERSRTWRFTGNAYFDLGAGRESAALEHAAQAYRSAEVALGGIDEPVEWVKLNYSYGQTLLYLSDGRDLKLADAASRRLKKALELARTYMPAGVSSLEELVHDADRVVTLLTEADGLGRRIDDLEEQLAPAEESEQRSAEATDFNAVFGLLQQEFEREKPALDPTRQAGLSSLMDGLADLVRQGTSSGQSLEDMLTNRGKLDALIREIQPQVKNPSLKGAGAPAGSRGEMLLARMQALKMFVGNMGMAQVEPGTRDAAIELFPRIARLTTWISEAGDDATQVRRLESDQARGLAHEVRRYARQHNLMLARPVWPRIRSQVDVNTVFYSGSRGVRSELERAAATRDLELLAEAEVGGDYAASRWAALRTAGIGVFDLSEAEPQVYYELGIALTLGTQLLLVAPESVTIPFDIAQNVSRYSGAAPTSGWLADELDGALYGLQVHGAKTSAIPATLAYAQRLAAAVDNPLLDVALQSLRSASEDPVRFADALHSFNTFLGPAEHEVLLPRWPGEYPEVNAPRCFAVMPFRVEHEAAYAAVAAAAQAAGVEPVRGDVAEGQEIIESIWQEICRATHVTVDLSGYNPNVCLELGIVHALGRNSLLIGTTGTERELQFRLPGVAKWRCHTYESDPQPQFHAMLRRFLTTR